MQKRILLVCLFLLASAGVARAQSSFVSASVSDEGKLVTVVTVKCGVTQTLTFGDSNGDGNWNYIRRQLNPEPRSINVYTLIDDDFLETADMSMSLYRTIRDLLNIATAIRDTSKINPTNRFTVTEKELRVFDEF